MGTGHEVPVLPLLFFSTLRPILGPDVRVPQPKSEI